MKTAMHACNAGVVTCAANEAVALLARGGTHYTHVLVNQRDADGLADTLADLTDEIAHPDTDMLMLGTGGSGTRPVRVIPVAEPGAVQEAVMSTSPRARPLSGVDDSALRAALDAGAIEVRYQPIVRVRDGRPVALEALARLTHPSLGTVAPDHFVPQIEAAGLAARFTELVSERVFADLEDPALASTGMHVSINFTLDVLLSSSALIVLERQRAAHGVPANRVIVELTESQPVRDIGKLRESVTHLRSLGYGVAIDDVGPAVPHLEPLLDLPFSSLKLDKVLVQQSDSSPDVLRYLSLAVRLAKKHGLTVIAEGVETEAIYSRMKAIGVQFIQGFLAARPLPRNAVPVWVRSWSDSNG
ncbi:EAL domain-containing protein [Rhodopila sp.]|uniref:EAL domain-containing protein n=1 Tax=Rhodopila sp. TaxID=2480087 RepID=UPI002D7F1491|nr:EAL domain-containing protein [Rhodopila sp.]